jgi:hypothetical protein
MEKEIKNVSLSFCCQEDWNSFASIDERARFCASCKHKVIDFTNANASEFNQLINSGQKICGRFKRSQMSESFLKMAAASLVMAASATSIRCTEQENVIPQVRKEESVEIELTGIIMGKPILARDHLQTGSHTLPIIVADATKGEEPVRYNPAIPSKGIYKNK